MIENNNNWATDNWRDVWERKGKANVDACGFKKFLIYAGYDSPTSTVNEEDYRSYVEAVCSKVSLNAADSVLDVGCGIGAFLRCLKPQPAKMVGVDYSSSVICRAKELNQNPQMQFYHSEADEVGRLKLGKFDVIISNGAFIYFPSLPYAIRVCNQMAGSSQDGGRIAILDVNDMDKKKSLMEMRYAQVGEDRYKELYNGLDQSFYRKDFFLETFRALGLSKILIEDQFMAASMNHSYRFNVFIGA